MYEVLAVQQPDGDDTTTALASDHRFLEVTGPHLVVGVRESRACDRIPVRSLDGWFADALPCLPCPVVHPLLLCDGLDREIEDVSDALILADERHAVGDALVSGQLTFPPPSAEALDEELLLLLREIGYPDLGVEEGDERLCSDLLNQPILRHRRFRDHRRRS